MALLIPDPQDDPVLPEGLRECAEIRVIQYVNVERTVGRTDEFSEKTRLSAGVVFEGGSRDRLFYRPGEIVRELASGKRIQYKGVVAEAVVVTYLAPGAEPAAPAESSETSKASPTGVSSAWQRFLAGHWTREAPTRPGAYVTCPLECPASRTFPTAVAIEREGRVELLEPWHGWFWSEPLPQLPNPPDCPF